MNHKFTIFLFIILSLNASQNAYYTFEIEKSNTLFVSHLSFKMISCDENKADFKNSKEKITTWYIFNDYFNQFRKPDSLAKIIIYPFINHSLQESHALVPSASTDTRIRFNWIDQKKKCKFANKFSFQLSEKGWEGSHYALMVFFTCLEHI